MSCIIYPWKELRKWPFCSAYWQALYYTLRNDWINMRTIQSLTRDYYRRDTMSIILIRVHLSFRIRWYWTHSSIDPSIWFSCQPWCYNQLTIRRWKRGLVKVPLLYHYICPTIWLPALLACSWNSVSGRFDIPSTARDLILNWGVKKQNHTWNAREKTP